MCSIFIISTEVSFQQVLVKTSHGVPLFTCSWTRSHSTYTKFIYSPVSKSKMIFLPKNQIEILKCLIKYMFHMWDGLLLAWPSISEIVFLMFIRPLTERRTALEAAGRDWDGVREPVRQLSKQTFLWNCSHNWCAQRYQMWSQTIGFVQETSCWVDYCFFYPKQCSG